VTVDCLRGPSIQTIHEFANKGKVAFLSPINQLLDNPAQRQATVVLSASPCNKALSVSAARGVEERLAPCRLAHSIDYCEQGIDGAAQYGAKRRVAFNAVRLPIRRIVGQYGDVARAALSAFERDGSIFARDRPVVL
jgi:hypothetical protein